MSLPPRLSFLQEPIYGKKLCRSPPPSPNTEPSKQHAEEAQTADIWLSNNRRLLKNLRILRDTHLAQERTKRETLFKAWSAHVFVPIMVSIAERLENETSDDWWTTRRKMYDKFLKYCSKPGAVLSFQYECYPETYDPLVLARGSYFKVSHRPLKDPCSLWARELMIERAMLNPDWPLRDGTQPRC